MTPDIHDLIERLGAGLEIANQLRLRGARKCADGYAVPFDSDLDLAAAALIETLSADLASAKEALGAETEACAKIAAKGVYYRIGQGNCFAPGSSEIAAAIRARTTLRSLNKEDGRV